ncbi:MAG: hypothetical protein IPO85_17105 [Saprospiraceae bacterium]|uniref:Uncharacterized protein n=1 Tax=Candidatus Defluviibacterium haderslevense TaxID=2981993 RepID=A0A9D7XEK5_9BACT|nr:hypothetical protein [Candidatus Defluviibacterium haderslevense]
MNSEKINIVRSIEQMDAELFEMLLNVDKTYQYVRKSVFVNKINDVFNELIEGGDTMLNSYPGICKSNDCNNRFCSGYRFVGNVSNKYFELIFKESRNEVDDIFQCFGLELDNPEVEKGERISYRIDAEYQDYFLLNSDFQEKKKVYLVAMEELNHYKDIEMPFEVLESWVSRYISFYDSLLNVSILLNTFDNFKSIFIRFKFLVDIFSRNIEAKLAYERYLLLDLDNEKAILRWLVDHEELGAEFHQFDVFNISKNGNDEIDGLKKGEINIDVENFRNCINFHFAFQEHIHKMKNKYYVEYDNPNDLPYYIDDVQIHSDIELEFIRSLRLQLIKGGVEF